MESNGKIHLTTEEHAAFVQCFRLSRKLYAPSYGINAICIFALFSSHNLLSQCAERCPYDIDFLHITRDERIAAIVNHNSAPLNHNEAEIAGYRDALNAIHLGYDNIDFREADILRLHEMMMSIAGYEYGGQYKTDDNVILEVDADGSRQVRFRPTPAAETKQAMEQLELAYVFILIRIENELSLKQTMT